MSNEVRICTSCWEEDCVCDYERYVMLDEGMVDIIATLNLKGYQTMYSCEGHIVGDIGSSHGHVMDINLVCPNHRFETLPEGFAYPKGAKHRDIHRTILYKYVKGKLLAMVDGKYIPYDLESDRQKHLETLKLWADSLPAIDIKKHPECYSEYLVTGRPKQSYLEYELPQCRTFTVQIKPAEYDSTIHHIVGYCGKALEVQEIGEMLEIHYWAKTDLFE